MGYLENIMLAYIDKQKLQIIHCNELIKRISVYKDVFNNYELKMLTDIEIMLTKKQNYLNNKYNYILNL